jgi:hypothetical protein
LCRISEGNDPEQPATGQVAISTIAPFVIGLCATRVTVVIGEKYGWDTMPVLLVTWCVALGISATWLSRAVFRRTRMLVPFLAAMGVILLIWLWQRQAFIMFVPRSGLTYGYFLKPDAAKARFWTLTCPLRVGLTCLSICFIAALVSAWRAGFRFLSACIIPWWLTAFLIFSLLRCISTRKEMRRYGASTADLSGNRKLTRSYLINRLQAICSLFA